MPIPSDNDVPCPSILKRALEAAEVPAGVEHDAFSFGYRDAACVPGRVAELEHQPDRAIGEHACIDEVPRHMKLALGPNARAAAAARFTHRIEVGALTGVAW